MTAKAQDIIFNYRVEHLGRFDWHNSMYDNCPFCGARRKILYFEKDNVLRVEWCQPKPQQEVCTHLIGLDSDKMTAIYKKQEEEIKE